MAHRDRVRRMIVAASVLVFMPFSQWISTTRLGTSLFLWGEALIAMLVVFTLLAVPGFLVGLFFTRSRRLSCEALLVAVLLIPCGLLGIFLGQKVRTAGMLAFTQRSQLLVAAITRYEQDHSRPPHSLADLVPDYLPVIPSTGMMAAPEYHYHTGDEARDQYCRNPWALSVQTPSGGLNFDMMLYLPRQNYPSRAWGGGLEIIGTWACVHE